MAKQIDFTGGPTPEKPKRGRKAAPAAAEPAAGEGTGTPSGDRAPREQAPEPGISDPAAFDDVARLAKKGLRVVPVVTGAVVDAGGNFLFYVDGHEDARSGVQAQLNHLLGSGPAREEHLAPARARVRELFEKLAQPR